MKGHRRDRREFHNQEPRRAKISFIINIQWADVRIAASALFVRFEPDPVVAAAGWLVFAN
jgi:hypothetical protein